MPEQVLRYEKIFDSLSDWISIIDLDSKIKYTNITGGKLFGLSKDEIINQKCCRIIHNKDFLVKDCPLKKMLNSKKKESAEFFLEEKNIWYEITVNPIFDKNKKITGAVHIVRDITEENLTNKALKDSKKIFDQFKDSSTESFSIWDSDFNLVDVNEYTLKNFQPPGTKKEDIIGKNILKIIPNLDKLDRYKEYLKVMKTGKPVSYDDIVLHPVVGGQHISIKVFKVGEGLGVIAENITEKKKAEEALKESEEKYRTIINSSLDGFLIINTDWNILEVNNSYCKMLGYNREELLSMNLSKIEVMLSKSEMEIYQKEVIKKGFSRFESKHKKKDGKIIDVSVLVQLNKEGNGFAFIKDITEKKKIEEALKIEKSKFETYFENLMDGLGVCDLNGNIVQINRTFATIHGFKSKKEVIGENITKFVTESSRERALQGFQETIKKGLVRDFEIHALTKHGKEFPALINASLIDSGDKKEIIAVLKNISDKKKAEKAIKESEEKYRSIVDSSNNVIVRAECNGIINYINHTISGVSKDKIIGKTIYDYIDPKYHKLVRKKLEKVVKTGKPSSYQLQGIGPRGTTSWYHSTISPIIHDGKINAVTIITEDISNQKKADDIIKESELKYRTLFETSPEGLLTMNLKGFVTRANSAFFKLSGYSKSEIIGKHFTRLPVLRKRDLPRYIKLFATLLKKGEIDPIEYRWIHKSGDIRWGDGYFGLLKNEGKKIGVQLAVVDTTERKKADLALKESEEKYRLIINTAPTIITIIDKDFIIKDINYTVSGIDKKDVIGKKIFEFLEPRFHNKVEKTLQNVVNTKKSSQYEAQGKGPNNSIVWYDTRVGPIIKDGKVTEIIIMGNDITERKRREKEIQKQFLKFDIEEGNCYLVLEKSNIKATNAFDDVLKTGYNGIIISREKLKDLKTRINKDFSYLWLSEKPYNTSITPKNIKKYIEQIKKPSVILLDRFDYIMQKLGFNKTLSLLQSINEFAYIKDHIILISIDPDILDNKELSLIEKETIELEPKQKNQLDDDQIKILKYIFKQNLLNKKPSYTNLSDNLHYSKPTMRNKIRTLKEKGYLIEYKSGNKKKLEISEKTRSLLT